MRKHLCSLLVALVTVSGALAEETCPIELSFMDWLYRPSDVAGLRLGIPFGKNDAVTGVDVGFWGQSDYAWAFQFNVVANVVRDDMGGLQVALYNFAGNLTGIQVGLWNRALTGAGAQIGLLNLADQINGFQIGVVNRTEIMHGYQIGLVNVIRESPVPFFTILNFYF